MTRHFNVADSDDAQQRSSELLTLSVCQELADSLRGWAEAELLPGAEVDKLKRFVSILQSHVDDWLNPSGYFFSRQFGYPVLCLINSILMVSLMRSQTGRSLEAVCMKACQVLFPHAWGEIWAEYFTGRTLSVPTSTTLSRR